MQVVKQGIVHICIFSMTVNESAIKIARVAGFVNYICLHLKFCHIFAPQVMHKCLIIILALACWTGIVQLTIPIVDNIRFLTWPFPASFCYVHILAKVVLKSVTLLHLDAIIITKYVLIFWLKNPGAVNDEFWCIFINIWDR